MSEPETVSLPTGLDAKYGGAPIVFFQEKNLFGDRKPDPTRWLKHGEMYHSLAKVIDSSHLTGLQRVNGLWRIYIDNLDDKVALLEDGVNLRGKPLSLLSTNPNRLDGEGTIKVTVKNIPLSVDDGVISRALILKGLEVITLNRVKLRIDGKLTNCENGDRALIVKSSSLKEPLPRFMSFGKYTGRIIHFGQEPPKVNKPVICKKCLLEGHMFHECMNDWACLDCGQSGHKRGQCDLAESSESETEDSGHESSVPTDPLAVNEPAILPEKTPARRVAKAAKSITGQQTIKNFCTPSVPGTPGGPGKIVHSPPTPSELLNDLSKKTRVAGDFTASDVNDAAAEGT